jgi:hypothetical protein
MASKADYEAAKQARRDGQWAATGIQPAPESAIRPDEAIRFADTPESGDQAIEAAGVAKVTTLMLFQAPNDPIADPLMRWIFPKLAKPGLTLGFCVVVRPGRVIAEDEGIEDKETGDITLVVRGTPELAAGEIVFASLFRPQGRRGLQCIASVNYPRLVLPDQGTAYISGISDPEDINYAEEYGDRQGVRLGEIMRG